VLGRSGRHYGMDELVCFVRLNNGRLGCRRASSGEAEVELIFVAGILDRLTKEEAPVSNSRDEK